MKRLFGEIKKESPVENPFKADKIQKIDFSYRRLNLFGDVVNDFVAYIYFKNGDTEGSQRIEAKSFPELYEKVINFCNAL